MAALVSYGSSDEEDDRAEELQQLRHRTDKLPALANTTAHDAEVSRPSNGKTPSAEATTQRSSAPVYHTEALQGPIIGPMIPAEIAAMPMSIENDQGATPQSPYSANRALLRDLTLPSVPNYDIPPSPPGSPKPSTNAKFKHFLDLKRQGLHFNEKLAGSAALKNPSLMQKLMDFADIDEAEQYLTTLPKDLWDSQVFPDWAFKDELRKSQEQITKRREEQKLKVERDTVDFVPASAASDGTSRGGTPSVVSRGSQKSAAERVMAGLDRGRSNSPQVPLFKRKTRFES